MISIEEMRSRFNYLKQHMMIDGKQGVRYPRYPTMELYNLIEEFLDDV